MPTKEYRNRAGRKRSSNSSIFCWNTIIKNAVKCSLKIVLPTAKKIKKIWQLRRKWQHFVLAILGMGLFLGMHIIAAPPVRASTTSVNKSFDPIEIDPGAVSQLTISFFNSHPTDITGGELQDNLQGDPTSGIVVADPVTVVQNTCGAIINNNNLAAGDTLLDLTNITVPAASGGNSGRCDVTVNVTSTIPNNNINSIAANTFTNNQALTNADPANATLSVLEKNPPSLSKNFIPNTILINGTSILSIRITNNADIDITEVAFTDNLPSGVTGTGVINQNASCIGGTIFNNTASNSIDISGITIAPSATCQIDVEVTSSTPNVYNNNIPVNSITNRQGLTNQGNASATLDVQDLATPTVNKQFRNDPILPGTNSRLRINITNESGAVPITGVSLTDVLPTGVFVNSNPNVSTNNNCQRGGTVTANPNDTQIVISGFTIPADRTCRIEVNVTANNNGRYENIISPGDVTTDQGVSNQNETRDTLVVEGLRLQKSFSPTPINPGETSTVTITLLNATENPLTGTNFTDNLPNTVVVADPTNASTTCDLGTIAATPGNTSFSFSGGTIPARTAVSSPGSCTISVDVVGNTANQTINNNIPANAVVTTQGISNDRSATGTLRVGNDGFNLIKQFVNPNNTNQISIFDAGSPFRVRFRIQLPINIPIPTLTDVTFSDTLPAGLEIANPPNINFSDGDCRNDGGQTSSVTATPGTSTINVSGIDLQRSTQTNNDNRTCDVFVNVVAPLQGTYTNDIAIGDASATAPNIGTVNNLNATSATIDIAGVNIIKEFFPTVIAPQGRSTLRVTIVNNETSFIEGTSLTDTFPSQITIADPPNAVTTCGSGTVSATIGGNSFSLNNGRVPPRQGTIPGLCTFQVDVTGNTNGTANNNIPALTLTNTNGRGSNISATNASLTITPLNVGVNQSFVPIEVSNGARSLLTVTLRNPSSNGNNVTLFDTSFTANFDPGLIIASPANTNTTCTNGVVDAVPGEGNFSFSGGEIPPDSTCQVTLEVISTRQGNQSSTIAVGAVTTSQGATNQNASIVSLTNIGAQGGSGVSVGKAFSPNIIAPGATSRLSITIINVSNTTLTNLSLNDSLPTGVNTTLTPNGITTCGSGIVQTTTNSVILSGGTLASNSTCTVSVDVTAPNIGDFVNQIPANTINNDQNLSNDNPASANLRVTTAPTIAKSYSDTRIPLNTNSILTISLFNNDTVDISLTTSFVDRLPDGLVVANPVNTAGTTCDTNQLSLSPGGTTITYLPGAIIPVNDCNIVVEVTGVTEGTKSNTIAIGDLQTTAGQNVAPVSTNIIVEAGPEILLVKRITAINGNRTNNPNGGGDPFNGFIDDPTPNDNNPNWPPPFSTYLRGGINGGPVRSGDEIEYTVYFLSSGNLPANNLTICDVIRDNLSLVSDAFNGSSPQESGASVGADLGIALAFDDNASLPQAPTDPTVFLTNNNADSDRGQFFPALSQPPSACKSPTNFLAPASSFENVRGSVVVNVVSGANNVPNANSPGVPTNSYGFIRFLVRLD